MVKPWSGCCDAARDVLLSAPLVVVAPAAVVLRRGVPVRAGGAGLAALVVVALGIGDYNGFVSKYVRVRAYVC